MNILRRLSLILIVTALLAGGSWAFHRYQLLQRQTNAFQTNSPGALSWTEAAEKVRAPRPEAGVAMEVPEELRHYEDRHWFLATQVAEVHKFNVPSCQDFVHLAAMIQRGEMVSVPGVTDDYILYGVGEETDDKVFTRFADGENIELYDELELRNAYSRLESTRSSLENRISNLKTQLSALMKNERDKHDELQKELTAREQELAENVEKKALLDRSYGDPAQRERLLADYELLKELARNFGGRSFDLNKSTDRQEFKRYLLSSVRPQALRVIEEVAKAYHQQFDRPLPVSSLVRPEQYQHALRRVNRNAILIDVPPHTTGLAFDIDYRYMSGAEQNFIMQELARLEREGRIEVIRERNANYHVFAFMNGQRPSDELITAALDEASGWKLSEEAKDSEKETHHATKPPAVKASRASRSAGKKKPVVKANRTRPTKRSRRR